MSPNSQLVYYSAILQQSIGLWHFVLQHDFGSQQNGLKTGQTANWYSIVQYLTFQTTSDWNIGIRGEIFKDMDGFKYANGPGTYYAITGGLNWKPNSWLVLRPEARYDWSIAQIVLFNDNRSSNRLLIDIDAIIKFNGTCFGILS